VPGDDAVGSIGEDWIDETEFANAGRDLLNLFGRVGSCAFTDDLSNFPCILA
jgi:hypothetical protein